MAEPDLVNENIVDQTHVADAPDNADTYSNANDIEKIIDPPCLEQNQVCANNDKAGDSKMNQGDPIQEKIPSIVGDDLTNSDYPQQNGCCQKDKDDGKIFDPPFLEQKQVCARKDKVTDPKMDMEDPIQDNTRSTAEDCIKNSDNPEDNDNCHRDKDQNDVTKKFHGTAETDRQHKVDESSRTYVLPDRNPTFPRDANNDHVERTKWDSTGTATHPNSNTADRSADTYSESSVCTSIQSNSTSNCSKNNRCLHTVSSSSMKTQLMLEAQHTEDPPTTTENTSDITNCLSSESIDSSVSCSVSETIKPGIRKSKSENDITHLYQAETEKGTNPSDSKTISGKGSSASTRVSELTSHSSNQNTHEDSHQDNVFTHHSGPMPGGKRSRTFKSSEELSMSRAKIAKKMNAFDVCSMHDFSQRIDKETPKRRDISNRRGIPAWKDLTLNKIKFGHDSQSENQQLGSSIFDRNHRNVRESNDREVQYKQLNHGSHFRGNLPEQCRNHSRNISDTCQGNSRSRQQLFENQNSRQNSGMKDWGPHKVNSKTMCRNGHNPKYGNHKSEENYGHYYRKTTPEINAVPFLSEERSQIFSTRPVEDRISGVGIFRANVEHQRTETYVTHDSEREYDELDGNYKGLLSITSPDSNPVSTEPALIPDIPLEPGDPLTNHTNQLQSESPWKYFEVSLTTEDWKKIADFVLVKRRPLVLSCDAAPEVELPDQLQRNQPTGPFSGASITDTKSFPIKWQLMEEKRKMQLEHRLQKSNIRSNCRRRERIPNRIVRLLAWTVKKMKAMFCRK